MYLVIVVFSCIAIFHSANTELTIELVNASSAAYNLSPAAKDGQYDVSAGATVSVLCTVEGTPTTLSYASLELAKFPRFDDGERITKSSTSNWTLSDLQSYDTGSIDCLNATNNALIHKLYIYVYNESSPLYVPLNASESRSLFITYLKWSYLPCLPTSSQTEFWLLDKYHQHVDITVDSTRGINITSASPRNSYYYCMFKRNGRTNQFRIFLSLLDIGKLPYPWIIVPNSRREYVAGQSLTLLCRVRYADAEVFLWSYPAGNCSANVCQGRVTVEEPKTLHTTYSSRVTSKITIRSLEAADSGDYVCSYRAYGDKVFRRNTATKIRVHQPYARGRTEKVTLTGSEGDRKIILTKRLTALPRPQLLWTFESRPLDLNKTDKYTHSLTSIGNRIYIANLTIKFLKEEDDGLYQIVAMKNGETLFSSSFQLNIRLAPGLIYSYSYEDRHKYVTEQLQTLYVRQNGTLALECEITRGDPQPRLAWHWQRCNYSNSCITQPTSWFPFPISLMQPSKMVDNQAYVSETTPKSQRLTVRAERSGWYRCTARNSVRSTEQILRVVVTLLPESSKGVGFTANTLKKASTLVENDNLLLDCHVARFECQASDVEIIGTGGNHTVIYRRGSASVKFEQGDNEYKMKVKLANIFMSMDSDVYYCRCTDGKQGPSLTLSVNEYIAPFWTVQAEGDQALSVGDSKSFLCIPEGRPLPQVSWYKDGALVKASNTFLLSEDMYNLTIVKAAKGDAGLYKCKGTTDRGSIYSSFALTLKDKEMKISTQYIVIFSLSAAFLVALSGFIAAALVRKHCRKRYMPHELLLPSKETLNPNIPIDEQTDALRYDDNWEFPMSSLKLGMLLGQGEFGRVLKAEAMNIEEGVASTTVAVKTVRDQNDLNQIKSLISELKILIHIGQHLNIVNLLGACTKDISKGHLLVIVEYCCHGNLRTYLLQHQEDLMVASGCGGKLVGGSVSSPSSVEDGYMNGELLHLPQETPVTLRDIMSWCYQIARGMEYLASIDYIHRDLAARNVLLAEGNIVKICDFGLSKDIYKYKEYQKENEGPMPIKWMAIESLTHKVFNVKTDIWAYGVTMWELFSLAATPYPGWTIDDTYVNKLIEGRRMDRPKHCPRQIYEHIMLCCWDADAEKRPNFSRISSLLGRLLDISVLESLHQKESSYHNRTRSNSLLSEQKDEVFVELDYLTPTSHPDSGKTQAKYYNVPKVSMKKLQMNNDDLEIPNELAPPIPMHQSNSTACCSSSSSDGGSSRNTRPPSYTFVMDNQDLSPDSFQLHLSSLQSIDV